MSNYPKNLKYPEEQYNKLLIVLKQLGQYVDLFKTQPNQLHYLAFSQTSKGQLHNKIYITDEGLKRAHSMSVIKGQPIINVDFELELYPSDCNDNHIETIVKRAIKELSLDGSWKRK